MQVNPRTATTALALVLGIAAAPAAASNATGSSPTVRPNPDEQIVTTPPKPTHASQPAAQAVQPNPDEQTLTATNTGQPPIPNTPAVIVRVNNGKSGFDWGDAGIGAAGAVGLSVIAFAGGLAVTQRRARRTGSAAATH